MANLSATSSVPIRVHPWFTFCLLLSLFPSLPLTVSAATPAAIPVPHPTPEQSEFFEAKIRPILANRCFECHNDKKQKSGLRLDSLAFVLAGGDEGKAVVPFEPEKSRLIEAIRYKDRDLEMPPEGKIPDAEIELLAKWIAMGLPWPGHDAAPGAAVKRGREITDADRAFWSYQPIVARPPAAVKNTAWPVNDIDRFILADLEAAGLAPAPAADRRTLIRRATIDLTGLPPTLDEIAAFLADPAPDAAAFARVVDRLLASPHYGERQARHWQDTVRYADTSGLEQDRERPNTFRYRDYLIDAFNDDLPLDQLLREHIAGDLLPARAGQRGETNVAPIGTTFLWFHEMFHMPIDPNQQRYDQIDAQIDVIGKAFLGHTISCARCHDHKFDPVTAKDYTALAGILNSTDFGTRRFAPRADYSEVDPERAKTVNEKQAELDRLRLKYMAEARQRLEKKWTEPVQITEDNLWGKEPAILAEKRAELQKIDPTTLLWTRTAIESPKPGDLPVFLRGQHKSKGEVVPRRFLEVLSGTDAPDLKNESGRRYLAAKLTAPDNPLTPRVLVNRIWLHHFGAGLVRTPDNFAALGEKPTHPALLDWLAARFIADGWSVKKMHRLIMNSRAWQMSAVQSPAATARDPANRLFHRQNLRRIDAEVIRDSLFAQAGTLDRTMFGECVLTYISPNATSIRPEMVPPTGPEDGARRRSIYILVRRKNFDPLLKAFDLADPSNSTGQRDESIVPPQSLALLNSPVVHEQSRILGALAAARPGPDADRLAWLCETILARPPTAAETKLLLPLAATGPTGWADVTHVLWNSADFLFVN